MSYLDYIIFFHKRDEQHRFSPSATRLYIKLLHVANLLGWPTDFSKPDPYVAAVCGLSLNTVKSCRDQLAIGGLLKATSGGTGRNAATIYELLNPSNSDGFNGVNPSNSNALPPINPSEFDGLGQENQSNFDGFGSLNPSNSDGFTPESELNPPVNPSKFDTLSIDKEKEESRAASAATPPPSFSVEKSEKSQPAASRKKSAARSDEVAALELPHSGAEFAELWAEFRAMPKQVKKPVTSLRRLLATLGKYEEGFAQLMLEKAIEGNWSGVEFDSTAKAYAEWRAAQAERARRQPVRTSSPDENGPELNHAFLDEVAARRQAEEDAHFARWQVPSVPVDPNKEFGYDQTAAEGLAQARATPEYQQYLDELEATKKQAATDAEPEPPASSPENPSDSPPQAA